MSIDLRLGDNVEVMRSLPDGSIDLIVTSPPYDDLRAYASGCSFDFEGVAEQSLRVLKPGGVLVWVVNDGTKDGSESGTSFRQALRFKEIGFRLHDTMIWRKPNPMPCGSPLTYTPAFEFMFVFSKGKPKVVNRLMEPCKNAGKINTGISRRDGIRHLKSGHGRPVKSHKPRINVWDYCLGTNRFPEHPAVFPLQLATDHLASWSNPDDTVLDPFMGSGTTGLACLNAGRNFIGIELSPEYYAIAQQRISETLTLVG